MGYPMTFQRIMNRNHLDEWDYGKAPGGFNTRIGEGAPLSEIPANDGKEPDKYVLYLAIQEIEHLRGKLAMIGGDFRRLVRDTLDERTTCNTLANRVNADENVVAAVLTEWVNW